ncbi:uncharacterized protein [Solanum tuberosum]|uniref:uncharacterized protein n=1 Tax=Solanum tuberosum TaxID=4113 RepID=UPI000739FC6D|nr:PREDICTED: uncharacterized protein LOC107057933 [Solanum tuberosum]
MTKINGYKRYFGFQHCMANNNGQIWCFWNNGGHTQVIANTDQQLTLHLKDSPSDTGIFVTAVYAKCSDITEMNNNINDMQTNRINALLGKLISENQSGFVSGRLITDNVMLSQEIIHGIAKENIGGNVVLKLDMAKAYDRLSWSFLIKV